MSIDNFVGSPLLMGIIFFVAGMIMQVFPPKKINPWYGYRTSTSMQNQQTWDEANRYAARKMWVLGLYCIIIGIAIAFAVSYWVPNSLHGAIVSGSIIVSVLLPSLILIISTEKHLKRTFKE